MKTKETTMSPWSGGAVTQEYGMVRKAIFSLMRGMSFQQIVDYGYSIFGNPFYLVSDGILLYSPHRPSPVATSFLDMLRNTAPVCSEALYMLTSDQYRQMRQETAAPILIDCSHLGLRLLTAKVEYKGDIIATLDVLESEKVFEENDALYLQIIAEYISETLQGEENTVFSALFFQQQLAGILSGEPYSVQNLFLPQDTEGLPAYMIRVAMQNEKIPSFLENHGGSQDGLYYARCLPFEDSIVYLCIPSGHGQKEKMSAFFSSLAAEGVPIGISAPFLDRQAIVKHYYQAKKMTELIGSLGAEKKLLYFPEHLIDAFLLDASRYSPIDRYLDRPFYRFHLADRQKDGIYMQTLQSWFLNGCNLQKTSESLGIHRNSLTKRLNKIERLLGHSLEADDSLFDCLFMDKLARFLETMEEMDLWK